CFVKRWRPIWKSLPFLTFVSDPRLDGAMKGDRFMDFVSRELMLRDDSDIQTLTVSWLDFLEEGVNISNTVNTWIFSAIRRKIKELVLSININSNQMFKFPFKSSGVLVCFFVTGIIFLQQDQHSTNNFLKSCPALESLTIRNCLIGDIKYASITLKHFKIEYSYFAKILVRPGLLYCKSCMTLLYGLNFLNSLVKVNIETMVQETKNDPFTYSELPGVFKDLISGSSMTMLRDLRYAKDLTLSPRVVEIISRSPDLSKTCLYRFANLRCMELHTFLSKDCIRAILYLLKISPNVESLSLRIDKDCFAEQPRYQYCDEIKIDSENIGDYWEPRLALPCMPLHLKSIVLECVMGTVNELKFLEILLKNSVKLEKVVLFSTWEGPGYIAERLMKFGAKLQSFPKASSRVSIVSF
ncbi:hypothetical protein MKX01_015332, partial [Papaver californicum]